MEHISKAAIQHAQAIFTGKNHAECLIQLPMTRDKTLDIQGFLTSRGRFVSRDIAYDIAARAGQIKADLRPNRILYSEDLFHSKKYASA